MRAVLLLTAVSCLAADSIRAEAPYDFRRRLETVHQPDRRDARETCAADELELRAGVSISIPKSAGEVLRRAARDFEDYLSVSMKIDAGGVWRKGGAPGIRVSIGGERGYAVSVDKEVAIVAADERQAAQAFYHLEDQMNLRKGPFLRKGVEHRAPYFDVRMTHSGYGVDVFPDEHLSQMAHAGMTAILVFLVDIDRTKAQDYQDIKALIRRAARFGLDTYLYSYIEAFAHPDDGDAAFEASYGRIAGYYPEAKGIILVGESCQFPSKDPRVRTGREADPNDRRPKAGWYPCRDYPQWLQAVQRAIRAKAPRMETVFWTYNWGWAEEKERVRLVNDLPADTTLMATFEMFENLVKRNGLQCSIADYSLAFAGPGKYFASEALAASRRGLRLYAQANSGGVTWDFGTVPYQPCPYQWAARWNAMVGARRTWGLSGVMENHHFGWWPSFISELEKEAFTEGGLPFDRHIRAIAARDFGRENAEKAVAVWKRWSDVARDYVPTIANQYGPFRIGPSYPYNYGGGRVVKDGFPGDRYASHGVGICRLNYIDSSYFGGKSGEEYQTERMKLELELLPSMARALDEGADFFSGIATPAAHEMVVLGRYMARSVTTAVNAKRGALAFLGNDKDAVLSIAREEYANAKAALDLVEDNSRLGWEPTMEYVGGPRQINWKLKLMEETYGQALFRK